jgi:hypothetical protein
MGARASEGAKGTARGAEPRVEAELRAALLERLRRRIAADTRTRFGLSIARLRDELGALARRGNLNLSLGVAVAVGGLAVLGHFAFAAGNGDLPPAAAVSVFLPRLSLVLFIEVFAWFFLQTYRSTLAEIRYFQNELTNLESKAIALEASALAGTTAGLEAVIALIAATERNRVLERDQTTVELEGAKLSDERVSELLRELLAAIAARGDAG